MQQMTIEPVDFRKHLIINKHERVEHSNEYYHITVSQRVFLKSIQPTKDTNQKDPFSLHPAFD